MAVSATIDADHPFRGKALNTVGTLAKSVSTGFHTLVADATLNAAVLTLPIDPTGDHNATYYPLSIPDDAAGILGLRNSFVLDGGTFSTKPVVAVLGLIGNDDNQAWRELSEVGGSSHLHTLDNTSMIDAGSNVIKGKLTKIDLAGAREVRVYMTTEGAITGGGGSESIAIEACRFGPVV